MPLDGKAHQNRAMRRERVSDRFSVMIRCLIAFCAVQCLAQQANWTGSYQPCLNSAELNRTGPLKVGVRYDISDRFVIQQFHRAFEFWSKLLDAEFYDEPSAACAIAVIEGTGALLSRPNIVARAQLPDRLNFHGLIAVDPKASTYLTDDEAVATWIHEVGHLLGLKHNPSATSVMYYIDAGPASKLDSCAWTMPMSCHVQK